MTMLTNPARLGWTLLALLLLGTTSRLHTAWQPVFHARALRVMYWREADTSSASAAAIAARFEALFAAYRQSSCAKFERGRITYRDTELTLRGGRIVTAVAFQESPAYPATAEWNNVFGPAELDIVLQSRTGSEKTLRATADPNVPANDAFAATLMPPFDSDPSVSNHPTSLTYVVDRDRLAMFSNVAPAFVPADLDNVGIEDVYGSKMIATIKSRASGARAPRPRLGDFWLVEGTQRFRFDARNMRANLARTVYRAELPRDERSFDAVFSPRAVRREPFRPPCLEAAAQ